MSGIGDLSRCHFLMRSKCWKLELHLARLAWPDEAMSSGSGCPKRCEVDVRCNLVAGILFSPRVIQRKEANCILAFHANVSAE
jgi:hypothetical protein